MFRKVTPVKSGATGMINQKQASGYAVRLTETLHDRIIFVFTVIMGSALVIAARQLTLPVQCAMIDVPIDACKTLYLLSSVGR